MKRGSLICFIGVDGSGKTTQAEMLAETLLKQGIRVKYLWNGFEPLLTKPLMAIGRRVFLKGKEMFINYPDYLEAKRNFFRNRFLFTVYHYLVLADYFFQSLGKIRLPLALGRAVICDRYIYDVVGFLAADGHYSEKQIRKSLRHYLHLFPKPDLTFLLDLPEEVAYQRKNDIPSLSYLSEPREIYLSMAKSQEIATLDGTKDPSELAEIIQHKLTGRLLERR